MNSGVGGNKLTIIYTLKKCGTHLVSNICSLLIDKNCDIYNKDNMYKVVPHYTGGNIMTHNGVLSTHPNYLAYSSNLLLRYRILSIVRNPVDVCISNYFYNECRRGRQEIKEINMFVMMKIDGVCQNLRDHIKFITKNNNGKRLLLSYEKLVGKESDKIVEIDKIRQFLKDGGVSVSGITSEEILEKVNVEKAKVEEKKRGMYHVGIGQVFMFHRDGSYGQWRKYLRQDISDKVFQHIKVKYPDLYSRFYFDAVDAVDAVDASESGKTSADKSA